MSHLSIPVCVPYRMQILILPHLWIEIFNDIVHSLNLAQLLSRNLNVIFFFKAMVNSNKSRDLLPDPL